MNSVKIPPNPPFSKGGTRKSPFLVRVGERLLQGFTLVELAVVLVVLSILITAAIPNIVEDYNRTRTEIMIREIKSISSAARLFAMDHGGAWPKEASGCRGAVGKPNETGTLVGDDYLRGMDDTSSWSTPYVTRCDFSNQRALFAIEVKSDAKWAGLVANAIHATELYTEGPGILLKDATRTHVILPGGVLNEKKNNLLHRVAIKGHPELNQMNTTLNMTSEGGVQQNIINAKDVLALNNITAKVNIHAKVVTTGLLEAPRLVDTDDPNRYWLDPSGVSSLNALRSHDADSTALNALGYGSMAPEELFNSEPTSPNGSLNINDAYIRAGFKGKSFWLSSRALKCDWEDWSRCDGDMYIRVLWFEPGVKGGRNTVRFKCEGGRITAARVEYCGV